MRTCASLALGHRRPSLIAVRDVHIPPIGLEIGRQFISPIASHPPILNTFPVYGYPEKWKLPSGGESVKGETIRVGYI